MAIAEPPTDIDAAKLARFAQRAVVEAGATLNAALVVMGDRLGLYAALAGSAGLAPVELAERTGADARYVREWLNAQAAGGYVDYDPSTGRYALPPEHAVALTDPSSPAYVLGLLQLAFGAAVDSPHVTDAMRDGGGVAWDAHCGDVHAGHERLLRPGFRRHLVADWLPALDGAVAKLCRGARVADLGCGRGAATILMAEAFPDSTFEGSDVHAPSIAVATRHALAAGLAERVRFSASLPPASDYDLVTTFGSLHTFGDPVGEARGVRERLADDGTWMIVEPRAGDRVEDNLTVVGRLFYGLSTLISTPASLSQGVGLALGAQAGEARIRAVVEVAGFGRFQRVAETPFAHVFEARL